MRWRLTALLASAWWLLGCAQVGPPPGGPERKLPPQLVRVSPESGTVNARPKDVELQFDEVVSERPSGSVSLSDLVLISPTDGEPRVGWHRSTISVHPHRDWKANTVYTVTVLPGISDLRGNVLRDRRELVFATGPEIPATAIIGAAFDWVQGRPAPSAKVEAFTADTTTRYVAVTDSVGRFRLRHLPPARYTVRAFLDANNNKVLDTREPWDTVTVALADSVQTELYLFVHDSLGPRIAGVDVRDSLTLRVTFDHPIDPGETIDTTHFSLRGPDSTRIPIVVARTVNAFERTAGDTTRRDSAQLGAGAVPAIPSRRSAIPPVPPPTPHRAPPPTEVVLQVFPPLRTGTRYRLTARNIRGLLGGVAESERLFTTPRPVTRADTAARAPVTPPRRPPPSPGRPPMHR